MAEWKRDVLDHGFVRFVDRMGDDNAVVQMARVSYGEGTKTKRSDRALIRYLMRNRHTSPFEACELKLHLRMPIFVARQFLRHRTAAVNEYSARYSIVPDLFYVPKPEHVLGQSGDTKQARGGEVDAGLVEFWLDTVSGTATEAFAEYEAACSNGIARELARIMLPLNAYTEIYWKIDLHNLLHFLQLRLHDHAQYEIRVYAEAIAEYLAEWVPATWEAFEDYRLHAVTFSRTEMDILRDVFASNPEAVATLKLALATDSTKLALSKREREEMLKGLLPEGQRDELTLTVDTKAESD
jgi:thymidylate synthase (FAD)